MNRRERAKPNAQGGWRETLGGMLGNFALAPIAGVFAGFLLLFGGIFLGVAWLIGPGALVDSFRYAPYTQKAEGRIVESWIALEFDPGALPRDRLYWQPWATASACAVVEYDASWGEPLRRAFCGNRF
ncbi:MAG TPA: hypothetical protein VF132_05105, partial [Rudaea sp.]